MALVFSRGFGEEIVARFLGEAPVDLEGLAAKLGLAVEYAELPSGLSAQLRREGPVYVIRINRRHTAPRQRFTLAHMIAHYLLHRDLIGEGIEDDALYRSGLGPAFESEANRLAAELLMPAELVRRLHRSGLRSAEALAAAFQVSEEAMRIRLEQLGLPAEPRG